MGARRSEPVMVLDIGQGRDQPALRASHVVPVVEGYGTFHDITHYPIMHVPTDNKHESGRASAGKIG